MFNKRNASFYKNDGNFKFIKGFSFFLQTILAVSIVFMLSNLWTKEYMQNSVKNSDSSFVATTQNIKNAKNGIAQIMIKGSKDSDVLNNQAEIASAINDNDIKKFLKTADERTADVENKDADERPVLLKSLLIELSDLIGQRTTSNLVKSHTMTGEQVQNIKQDISDASGNYVEKVYKEKQRVDTEIGKHTKMMVVLGIVSIISILAILIMVHNISYSLLNIGETLVISAITGIIIMLIRQKKMNLNNTNVISGGSIPVVIAIGILILGGLFIILSFKDQSGSVRRRPGKYSFLKM